MKMKSALSVLAVLLLVLACDCKKASAPTGPHACKADDECVISCDALGDCCHNPYCESAQHRDDAKAAREENEKHCTPADQAKCPVIGSRVKPDYSVEVHCREAKCVVDKIPLPR